MKNPNSILVTGASSGLGAALAREYAAQGVTLFLSGRDEARLRAVQQDCESRGAAVHTALVDVANASAMADWIATCDRNVPLDLVIANAGIGEGFTTDRDLETHTRKIFAVNVEGVFNCLHPAIRLMQVRERGQVAIVSSFAGYHGLPTAPAYSASKACVKAYGEGLRGLYARHGIEVNVICPGFVKSRLTDRNKFPMPFLMEADKAAKIMRRGLERNRARISFPWQMVLIYGALVRFLPEGLFDRLFRVMPSKE